MLERKRGALPLYKQLEAIIKESIDNGEYSDGDILPAESAYMAEHGVSRITVRQALQGLASLGYVQGRPGIGTVVTHRKIEETLQGIKSFSDEMKEHGITMESIRCETARIVPPQPVASSLGIGDGDKCLMITRVRAAEGRPVVFSSTYIPLARNLPDNPACYEDSLYEYLSKEHGIIAAKATDTFEAVLSDRNIAENLCISEGEAVFKRTRRSFDQHSALIGISISYYPGKSYSYTIDL